MSDLRFPDVAPVVRPNGEAVVELRQNGELVAEINFTKIMANWFDALGLIPKPRHLKIVP